MSESEKILPISAALQAIGIESKDPAAWRRYWSKLGAPIVPGSWRGTRERFGADPEALSAFVDSRAEQMAREQDERSEKLKAKLQGQPVVPGFRYTMDEEQEMLKRWDHQLYEGRGAAPCEMCGAHIRNLRVGWHALRTLAEPPSFWARGGRRSDGLVLLCEKCVPLFDLMRRDTFESQAENWRLVRNARRAAAPGGPDETVRQRFLAMVDNEPMPEILEVVEQGHNFGSWVRPLHAAHCFKSGDKFPEELDMKWFSIEVQPKNYESPSGHLLLDVMEWNDRMMDRPHLAGESAVNPYRGDEELPLRLELTRGRSPVMRSAGWGGGRRAIEYAYDPSRTW